jgi:hypothetical protein
MRTMYSVSWMPQIEIDKESEVVDKTGTNFEKTDLGHL